MEATMARRRADAPTDTLYEYFVQEQWDLFLARCQTHPQDAEWRTTNGLRWTVLQKMLVDLHNQSNHWWSNGRRPPIECFEAAINAYPAATVMEIRGLSQVPIHVMAATGVHDDYLLELFALILDRSVQWELELVQSSLPHDLPPEVVRSHVYPYMANALTVRDNFGLTALHKLVRDGNRIALVTAKACQNLLEKAPFLAGMVLREDNTYPIHFAVQCDVPVELLRLLIDKCPESLEEKDEPETAGSTPLLLYIISWVLRNEVDETPNMEVLKVLAETRPRVNLIGYEARASRVTLSFHPWRYCCGANAQEARLYLQRLTLEQSRIPLSEEEQASGKYHVLGPEEQAALQARIDAAPENEAA